MSRVEKRISDEEGSGSWLALFSADAVVQDPARDLVQHEAARSEVDRMPGIRPALVSHDPICALGQDVDELALALIAPLCADHDNRPSTLVKHAPAPRR